MRRFSLIALLAVGLAGCAQLAAPKLPPPPAGYRLSHYRAPTPAELPGAQRVDARQLAARLQTAPRPLLIDVLPAGRLTDSDGVSHWLPNAPRRNLPGSVWLPNVGHGEPEPAMADWFARELARLSAGNRDAPLVFYCLRDCWMSWNAGKRALALGYRQVLWFADGSDGWQEAGLPLEDAAPLPYTPPR